METVGKKNRLKKNFVSGMIIQGIFRAHSIHGDDAMTARILCLIILLLELRGFSLSLSSRKWKVLVFYTQLSNLVTAVSAALLLLLGQPMWITVLRYLSSCMLLMTFFVTSCILVPMGGDPKLLLFSGNGLYHHLIIPIVSIGSYLLIERHIQSPTAILVPTALTFLYGMIMLWVNYKDIFDGPYPFFRVKHQSVAATVLWMTALTGAIGLLSFAIYRISP